MKKNKKGNNIFQSVLHPVVLWVYKLTAGSVIVNFIFRAKPKGIKLSRLKGSYILIGNHVNNYDSLIHQYYANRIISYVVNERLFRMGPKGLIGKIMNWVHFIPKKKFSNDIKAVRKLFKAKQEGRIIGIFPEGRRNWDGATNEIIASISTLAKSLKLPVVAAITRGGFASQPRWSDDIRHGKMEIEYKMILKEEDYKGKSADDLLEIIRTSLDHKEHEYLKENRIYYKSKNPADGLERLLYICPSCKSISTLKSDGDSVSCINCGYTATYNNYGELTSEHFQNLMEWNNWQKKIVKEKKDSGFEGAIFTDNDVLMSTVASNSYDKIKPKDTGTLKMYHDKIIFEGKEVYEFPLSDIWGCNIQKNCAFEFNYDKTMYMLTFPGKGNAYKWMTYTEL